MIHLIKIERFKSSSLTDLELGQVSFHRRERLCEDRVVEAVGAGCCRGRQRQMKGLSARGVRLGTPVDFRSLSLDVPDADASLILT